MFEQISDLDYFRKHPSWNLTGRSKRGSRRCNDTGGGERVVSMNFFLLVGLGINERSFRSQSTLLVQLAEAHVASAERAAIFENIATKK